MSIRRSRAKTAPRVGTHAIFSKGVEARYDISPPTRWRWERDGKLPPRDVYIGGKAVAWRPETLEAAERVSSS